MTGALVCLLAWGCEKKKESTTIIIPKQTVVKPADTIAWMERSETTRDIAWLNSNYSIRVVRQSVDSLPLAKDEIGNRYYDNVIHVTVSRGDGSKFFDKKVTKKMFSEFLTEEMKENGALLGVVFDRIEDNRLRFAGSVGSPDIQSDTYVPIIMLVDKDGHVSLQRDTDLDMHNQAADTTHIDDSQQNNDQDDGV